MDRRTTTSATTRARPDSQEDRARPRRSKKTRTGGDESDEGSLGRVRHRVTRACNECRRRKDRCDGQRPFCASCVAGGRACSYGPSKKRGLRTGYVRALEILLALVFNMFDESEACVFRLLQGQTECPNFRPRAAETHVSKDRAADFLLEAWRKGSVVKQVEQLLSRSEAVDDDDEGVDSSKYFDLRVAEALISSQTQDDGQTSTDFNSGALLSPMNTDATPGAPIFLNPDTTPIASQLSSNTHEAEPSSPAGSLSLPPYAGHRTRQNAPTTFVLPTHWPYLLDLYFATTHCWFPIAQKHELLRTAYTLANNTTTTNVSDSLSQGDSAFLHAVIAYTSQQASMIPNSQKPSGDSLEAATLFDTLTQSPLFDDPSSYNLGHVRALMLLSLFNIDQGLWVAAWAATGRAVYTAASLGLLPQDSGKTDGFSGDDGRRTLMGCAVLETLIAARINTKPFLRPSDITSIGSLQIDSLEEWEPWQPKVQLGGDRTPNHPGPHSHNPGYVVSTFNRLIELVAILNELLHNHRDRGSKTGLFETLQGYRQKLGNFHDSPVRVDIPPQALSLRVASVAVLEASAADCMTYSATCPERPAGYWSDMLSLVRLLEARFSQLGRCSIPPITQVSLEMLHRAIARHIQHVYDGGMAELQCLTDLLPRLLATWRDTGIVSSGPGPILNHNPDDQSNSIDDTERHSMNIRQPARLDRHTPATTFIASEMPITQQGSHMLLDEQVQHLSAQEHDHLQGAQPIITTSPEFNPDVALGSLPDSFTEDLDDDGLFDSLATLDSADWLANPPEFMQHLGVLGNAPSDLGSLFDTEP